ncbi:hypothetical protein M5D96_008571 [Drosophila gunungcola]|uniref:Uncharacterized protein n=1 Tax=Drosophila gunungcola TaxID=103775 RepID=A0A9P9YL97_9MUSC|nr:hypothetical protein M5D96_008571 [Drosophila gunungcola]
MPPTSKQMRNLFSAYFACFSPATAPHPCIFHFAFCQIAIGDFASCNSELDTCNWRCCTCAVSETSFCYFNLANQPHGGSGGSYPKKITAGRLEKLENHAEGHLVSMANEAEKLRENRNCRKAKHQKER